MRPSLRHRACELREGDAVRASLRPAAFRAGAGLEIAGRAARIEQHGKVRSELVVRDAETGEELAGLRRNGSRRRLELGGRVAEWKGLGRGKGVGFVGTDGDPLVVAKMRMGLFRSRIELEVDAELPDHEALVAALLASYLVIRRTGQQVTGATASAIAASS